MTFRQTKSRPVSPEVAFDGIIKALEPKLAAERFDLVEREQHPEAFGSQFATYSDGERFVRLTWDGKEKWFALEGDPWPDKRPCSGQPLWYDLTLQRFDPAKGDEKWVSELIEDVNAALEAFIQLNAD